MVLRVCLSCTALFPPGLERCPHCGEDNHVEQSEEAMAKISKAGGPTIEGVPGLDNQSDREEDQSGFLADPESGGIPSRADRIEQAEADRAAGRDPEEELRRRQSGEPAEEGDPNREQNEQQGEQGESDDRDRDYGGYTYNALQGLCKERGLPATGSHSELVNRLQDHDQRGERG